VTIPTSAPGAAAIMLDTRTAPYGLFLLRVSTLPPVTALPAVAA
jgi:hypothetical protein